MILEGFDIENWTCIKKLSVSGLPSTGVIVLHGPNRRGKSSLLKALRACLMDYASTSTNKKLTNCFPRGTSEKPTVAVTFRVGGSSYRIKKWFGTNKSELATRTSTGEWRVEPTSASDAHTRVRELAGGNDSDQGLHQLLWLTQAEFHLPAPGELDSSVQARMRDVLGVLQTPVDDRFIERVKKLWNVWHAGQRKVGKPGKLKDTSSLARNLSRLEEHRKKLEQHETKYREQEGFLLQIQDLEDQRSDLARQLSERAGEFQNRQAEREQTQGRFAARKLAEQRHASARTEQDAALDQHRRRIEAAQRLTQSRNALLPAGRKVAGSLSLVEELERQEKQTRDDLKSRHEQKQQLQDRANRVSAKLRQLEDFATLNVAQTTLSRVESFTNQISETKTFLLENPIPAANEIDELKIHDQQIRRLEADLNAASMILQVLPDVEATSARISVDGQVSRPLTISPAVASFSVRRTAQLLIPEWGRVELSRGSSLGDIDQIEDELRRRQEEYFSTLSKLGISAKDPDAYGQVVRRIVNHEAKSKELQDQERELKRIAPKGIEPLLRLVRELKTNLSNVELNDPMDVDAMPAERESLDRLRKALHHQMEALDVPIKNLELALEGVVAKLKEGREELTGAKEALARFEATANNHREELARHRPEAEIVARVDRARIALSEAENELRDSELTAEESTIEQRLANSEAAVQAIHDQMHDTDEKYNQIKGRLLGSEGLHADRAASAVQVDELTRCVERESLEKNAIDRLYELFEESREKQFGTLMGPIQDRVLSWMKVLDLGDYKEVRFSDAFLPEKLVRRDGTGEFDIVEESTGAQEQIGMLVRVALGSLLTKPDEPTVAILDDPLTHCDVGRLNKMRAILRRAAEGDSNQNPPAGPLQIIILTCHPEWFRDERATVIDLENLDVMQRFAV